MATASSVRKEFIASPDNTFAKIFSEMPAPTSKAEKKRQNKEKRRSTRGESSPKPLPTRSQPGRRGYEHSANSILIETIYPRVPTVTLDGELSPPPTIHPALRHGNPEDIPRDLSPLTSETGPKRVELTAPGQAVPDSPEFWDDIPLDDDDPIAGSSRRAIPLGYVTGNPGIPKPRLARLRNLIPQRISSSSQVAEPSTPVERDQIPSGHKQSDAPSAKPLPNTPIQTDPSVNMHSSPTLSVVRVPPLRAFAPQRPGKLARQAQPRRQAAELTRDNLRKSLDNNANEPTAGPPPSDESSSSSSSLTESAKRAMTMLHSVMCSDSWANFLKLMLIRVIPALFFTIWVIFTSVVCVFSLVFEKVVPSRFLVGCIAALAILATFAGMFGLCYSSDVRKQRVKQVNTLDTFVNRSQGSKKDGSHPSSASLTV
ncbi:MAG: hypothetical protein M1814_000528 [Vezdaea aestivalis]|nr:MAG: hypothetical protein M1814_000528 [Vezdaea aestivalis]